MTAAFLLSPEFVVLLFTAFCALWKGGKALDATWLFVPVATYCAWRMWAGRTKRQPVPAAVWWSAAIFLLLSVTSFVVSRTQNYGFDELLRDASAVLVLFWAARCGQLAIVKGRSFHERFLMLLATVVSLACVVGVAVYVLQPVNRFVGTFFDYRFHTDYWPNAWAEFVLLCWPALVYGLLRCKPQWRVPSALLLGAVLACLVLSYSRGGMIMFVGQCLLWVLLWGVQFWHKRPAIDPMGIRNGVVVMAAGLVAGVFVFSVVNDVRSRFHQVENLGQKIEFRADEGSSSFTERRDFFIQSWQLSWQRPWLGWGPYSFRFVQPRLQSGVLATSDHPHNVFLKTAMERGWPAAFALLVLFAAILLPVLVRAYRRGVQPASAEAASFIGVSGVLAHNLMDYNLQFVGILLPFAVSLGLIVAAGGADGAWKKWAERLAALALLLLLIVETRAQVFATLGRRAEAQDRPADAIAYYERAEGGLFLRDVSLSRAHLLIEQKRFDDALSVIADYRATNPEDPRGWKEQAEAFLGQRKYEESYQAYKNAFSLNRYNDVGALGGYVLTARLSGHRTDLETVKPDLDRLLQEFHDAVVKNAHFIALSSNVEEFMRVTAEMTQLFPQDRPQYNRLSEDVERESTRIREELQARPPGYLW